MADDTLPSKDYDSTLLRLHPEDANMIEEVAECLSGEDKLFADGFEPALVGYVQIFNTVLPLYDRDACISILIEQGATPDEAEEYFDFNVTGAYVGEGTPAFATLLRPARVELPSFVQALDSGLN